jgi:formylmethanofuran dehydrogenase subunit E
MPDLEELLRLSAQRHNHLCPRQVLGVRMGILAGRLLSLELPQTNKRLFTFIETDGCTLDGVGVATGCWPGRRTMHIMDFGKIAATFVDKLTGRAFRIHPHPEARVMWRTYAPEQPDRWHGYLEAYKIMPDEELLIVQQVVLSVSLEEIISRPRANALCTRCGEEINNDREVFVAGETLCKACAGEAYYAFLLPEQSDRKQHLKHIPKLHSL